MNIVNTPPDLFVVRFTNVDLYRSGSATNPHLDKVRIPPRDGTIDIETYEREVKGQSVIYVDSASGGISTFDAPLPSSNPKARWWKIPRDTVIPQGLMIIRDHTISELNITHYTIRPRHDMPLEEYKEWLRILAKSAQPHLI